MDFFEKYRNYRNMRKDGVISEEDFTKLENILIDQAISAGVIENREQVEEAIKNNDYKNAVNLLTEKTIDNYKSAIEVFEQLDGWRDSSALLEQCKTELAEMEKVEEEQRETEEKKQKYNRALECMSIKTVASYKEAIDLFEELGDWEESERFLEKCKNEFAEIEEKEKAKKAEEEAKKKKKIKLIAIAAGIVIAGIIAALITIDAMKPDLTDYKSLNTKFIHQMSYKIPNTWERNDKLSTDSYHYYKLINKDKTVAVITVEYKGETDLYGYAGYDEDEDEHDYDKRVNKELPDVHGVYNMVDAEESAFEVSLYCDDKKVKNREELWDTICNSFDTDNYTNPRKLTDVEIVYDGPTDDGTTIDMYDSVYFTVTQTFDTGIATGTKTPGVEVKEEVTLEAGKTSTVTLIIDDKEYSVQIKCPEKTGSRTGRRL